MTPEEFSTAQTTIPLEADRADSEPAMIVDVEGFEGPLDLLLTLARQQKVDLQVLADSNLNDVSLNLLQKLVWYVRLAILLRQSMQ